MYFSQEIDISIYRERTITKIFWNLYTKFNRLILVFIEIELLVKYSWKFTLANRFIIVFIEIKL